ncbi:MAG: homoserine O-acetyltransferase [Saprospiraceae bacterium]|nr:homoserine O-acetyltransferase [Saprospiraceae bacterium]
MTDHLRFFHHESPFQLESGLWIPKLRLAYTCFGNLNAAGDNAVWVFHALTANADPTDWWPGLVGHGKLIDPDQHFIVCVNMPGSCYGSFNPLDIHPGTGESYLHYFPFFTTRDMARAYQPLRKALGINKIRLGIGGSMGGQQLLEWAVDEPELFEHIVPISTNAAHSAWGKAFNASQRFAIENDETWQTQSSDAGSNGLKTARSIALLSYRNYNTYHKAQQDDAHDRISDFKSESYQRYQGEKLAKRFNAICYYKLTKSMDAHNVGRGRGDLSAALGKIRAKTLVIGILSDLLFPISEQHYLAENIPNAQFSAIDSFYGHDGFLLENEKISAAIQANFPSLFPNIKQANHTLLPCVQG